MPLIVICGIPCSGKTTKALELLNFLQVQCADQVIHLINEEALNINKCEAYKDALTEKTTRAALKAAVERHLSRETIVIIDSLNYIKGYRYELYCIARAAGTPLTVVLCDTPRSVACEWNANRSDSMPEHMFNELAMRFETPNPRNRWDSPLFVVTPDTSTPLDAILHASTKSPGLRPNTATQSQPLADTNFVHELERITHEITTTALAIVNDGVTGDGITVPHSKLKITFRHLTMAELRRLRKQFFKFVQLHPPPVLEIGDTFVNYINSNIS